MKKALFELTTFDEVCEALGGVARVGRMTRTNSSCVCNWRAKRQRFPSKFYRGMRKELRKLGYTAPDELWGQEELVVSRRLCQAAA